MTHHPRKRFGQNFLHDPSVIQRIVAAIHPTQGERLVEIGPGRGALTKELLLATGELETIELDRDLIEPLARSCGDLGRLHIHNADALKFDFCRLRQAPQRLRVVGNLPYNISTPLLFHLLSQSECIQDMYFMLQKEVVDRMSASPGSRTYGRLSVMLQVYAEVTSLFDIGPGAFTPAPKVDSSFVHLRPYRTPRVRIDDAKGLSRLVTQAFSQRRKTLRNNLKGIVDAETMQKLGIAPGLRAECLPLQAFAELANYACKNPKPT